MLRYSRALCTASAFPLLRSLKLDQLQAGPHDHILAIQDGIGIYSYATYKGASATETAEQLLTIPDDCRCVHSVFGRPDTPCDFAADIEFPKNDEAYTAEGILIELIANAHTELAAKGIAPETTLLLNSESRSKHSFHLHIQGKDKKAFKDVHSLRSFVTELLEKYPMQGLEPIDSIPYRKWGMMRTAFSVKFTDRTRALRPHAAADAALGRLIKTGNELSKVDQVALSMIQNAHAEGVKVGGASGKMITDANGYKVPADMTDDNKEKYFKRAVASLRSYPDSFCDTYDIWVRIGFCLHAFGFGEEGLQAWMRFSSRCRHKFDEAKTRKIWERWDRDDKEKDWRRAFGYLCLKLRKKAHATR